VFLCVSVRFLCSLLSKFVSSFHLQHSPQPHNDPIWTIICLLCHEVTKKETKAMALFTLLVHFSKLNSHFFLFIQESHLLHITFCVNSTLTYFKNPVCSMCDLFLELIHSVLTKMNIQMSASFSAFCFQCFTIPLFTWICHSWFSFLVLFSRLCSKFSGNGSRRYGSSYSVLSYFLRKARMLNV
jgi:hypothetical protein